MKTSHRAGSDDPADQYITTSDNTRSRAGKSRRAGIAGLAGSFLEYYDFASYAFLIVFMAPLFFPSDNPASPVLASFGVFAVGYAARPVGAFFFGSFGDRHGRRKALLVTVVGMGAATTVMGLIPTYASIGIAAPILLVLLRMVQGFSTGGESSGAATLVAESGDRRHGLRQALVPSGCIAGSSAAPFVIAITTAIVGTEEMATWGWRIPLLFSAVLTTVILMYRLRIEESEPFSALARESRLTRSPISTMLRSHWRQIVGVLVIALVTGIPQAILVSYMNVYMINVAGLARTTVYFVSAICLLLSISGYFLGGYLVDRRGARTALFSGLGALAVLIYPVMTLMLEYDHPALIGLLYTLVLTATATATTPVWAIATHAFPTSMRYSGVAVSTNIGSTLGQGTGPLMATALVAGTGVAQSPAFLMASAALVGIVVGLIITRSPHLRAEAHPDPEPDAAIAGHTA